MKKNNWKDTAELVGIAAIVASLTFVGLQIRQDRTIAESESFMEAANQITELGQLVSDNKKTWVKGLDGAELTAEEQSVFRGIYWALWVRKIAQWNRAQRLPNTLDPDVVVQDFAYDVYLYPGLRRVFSEDIVNLEKRRFAFGRDRSDAVFTTAVEEALTYLDANPPQMEDKTYYIY